MGEVMTPLSEMSARGLRGPLHGNGDLPASLAKSGADSGPYAHSRQLEPSDRELSEAMQMSFSNQGAAGSEPPKAALQRELLGPQGVSQVLRPEE